jgi:hypothetical protein
MLIGKSDVYQAYRELAIRWSVIWKRRQNTGLPGNNVKNSSAVINNGGHMLIGKSDVYQAYLELVIHSEKISWGRFGNYLVLNSILILAWAKLFESKTNFSAQVVMSAICIFGIAFGIAWSDLGKRGRTYLDEYKKKVKAIEEKAGSENWFEDGIPISDRPFQIKVPVNYWSSSTQLLSHTPYFFSVLNAIMLLATWMTLR